MTIDRRTDKEKGLHHHETTGDQHGNWTGGDKSKNFDQKVYFFPPSYNALRKELCENWPELWKRVGWPMVFAAQMFVDTMNAALDMNEVLDSERVDAVCSSYLQELQRRRFAAQPNALVIKH